MTKVRKNGLRIWGNTISTIALVVVLLSGFSSMVWYLARIDSRIDGMKVYIDMKTKARWDKGDDYKSLVDLCAKNNLKMIRHERIEE